jgi:hypothetical protein
MGLVMDVIGTKNIICQVARVLMMIIVGMEQWDLQGTIAATVPSNPHPL